MWIKLVLFFSRNWLKMYKDSNVQEVQRFQMVQGFKDSNVQDIQGFKRSKVQGFKGFKCSRLNYLNAEGS